MGQKNAVHPLGAITIMKRDLYFSKPLMNAAGSLGFAPDMRLGIPFDSLGAFVTNPISLRSRKPAAQPALRGGGRVVLHLRSRGAIAYGWVPLVLDAELLATIHGHDERIEVAALERAAQAMTEVVLRASA